ncbi:MAG: hypothetical protein NTZ63_02385 [Candidatus Omnitrophica bacterium]|nr:hypothetical protein [Candidatus Omnitrophota bacterium]
MLKYLIEDYNNYDYILHNGQYRVTLFVFEKNNYYPQYLLKIYSQENAGNLKQLQGLLQKINLYSLAILKDSVPKLLNLQEFGKSCVIKEEYVQGILLARYAEGRGLVWEKDFFLNLSLIAEWLVALHKNFTVGEISFSKDKVALLLKDTQQFLDTGFLNLKDGLITIPTVISHGDLMPMNVIRVKNKISVLDWDKMKTEGLPLWDLLTFILHYLHSRYRFQIEGVYLKPEVFLKYFSLIYQKDNAISRFVKERVGYYCSSLKLNDSQRDLLILLWIYDMLYLCGGKTNNPVSLPRLLKL